MDEDNRENRERHSSENKGTSSDQEAPDSFKPEANLSFGSTVKFMGEYGKLSNNLYAGSAGLETILWNGFTSKLAVNQRVLKASDYHYNQISQVKLIVKAPIGDTEFLISSNLLKTFAFKINFNVFF